MRPGRPAAAREDRAACAMSESKTRISGFLHTQSRLTKRWERRFARLSESGRVVLYDADLMRTKGKMLRQAELIVSGVRVSSETADGREFTLHVDTHSHGAIVLALDSAETMTKWAMALLSATLSSFVSIKPQAVLERSPTRLISAPAGLAAVRAALMLTVSRRNASIIRREEREATRRRLRRMGTWDDTPVPGAGSASESTTDATSTSSLSFDEDAAGGAPAEAGARPKVSDLRGSRRVPLPALVSTASSASAAPDAAAAPSPHHRHLRTLRMRKRERFSSRAPIPSFAAFASAVLLPVDANSSAKRALRQLASHFLSDPDAANPHAADHLDKVLLRMMDELWFATLRSQRPKAVLPRGLSRQASTMSMDGRRGLLQRLNSVGTESPTAHRHSIHVGSMADSSAAEKTPNGYTHSGGSNNKNSNNDSNNNSSSSNNSNKSNGENHHSRDTMSKGARGGGNGAPSAARKGPLGVASDIGSAISKALGSEKSQYAKEMMSRREFRLSLLHTLNELVGAYFSFAWDDTAALLAANSATRDTTQEALLAGESRGKQLWRRLKTLWYRRRATDLLKAQRDFRTLGHLLKIARADGVSNALKFRSESQEGALVAQFEGSQTRQPVILMLGGGMGAGKSSILHELFTEEPWKSLLSGAVIIEADKLKMHDPIFRRLQTASSEKVADAGELASFVHSFSTSAANKLLLAALRAGRDIIMDGTLTWFEYVRQTINMAKNAHLYEYRLGPGYTPELEQYWEIVGELSPSERSRRMQYEVAIVGVCCDPRLAVARGLRRKLLTGRGVPVAPQLRSHMLFSMNFTRYAAMVDTIALYDTTEWGERPALIAHKSASATKGQLLVQPRRFLRFARQKALRIGAIGAGELFEGAARSAAELPKELSADVGAERKVVGKELIFAEDICRPMADVKVPLEALRNPDGALAPGGEPEDVAVLPEMYLARQYLEGLGLRVHAQLLNSLARAAATHRRREAQTEREESRQCDD